MLFIALPCTSAPKETIVVVLSEDEMAQLNTELYSNDSLLSLRKKAMLLLGLKMGMRSSDIVKLEYDDINWETASIRFIQDKTEVEVDLPMPTDVGNTLLLFVNLPGSDSVRIRQIKRRYSIKYSDAFFIRLLYPVPSVIITTFHINTKAGNLSDQSLISCLIHQHRHCLCKQGYDNNLRRKLQSIFSRII